jgi:large subunit ribosomal protein L24
MAMHIRKNDVVEIIAGDHKGARGKILYIDLKHDRVVVEGVNIIFRHVRPTRKNPQGGRIQKEAPIHLSNVLPYDSSMGRGSRVHFEAVRDSAGMRVEKRRLTRSGTVLHTVSKTSKKES